MPEGSLQVLPAQLATVTGVLRRFVPGLEVWAFGSRVAGAAKPHSDLDLVVLGDDAPDYRQRGLLSEAFEESSLPWKVDVTWWADVSPGLRKTIAARHFVVQVPGRPVAGAQERAGSGPDPH